ncbi:MAG: glycogen synthase GlgA [Gammaproteobacteria bacterium]|nr:glycogen synthase GlgA [Gammaproteobacteria bacterium]
MTSHDCSLSVLHAATELFPWIKTGGLADVAAALPEALGTIGVDTRLVIPGFPDVISALRDDRVVYEAQGLLGTSRMQLRLGTLPSRNTPVYVIDAPSLYARPGSPYSHPHNGDWGDNLIRFAMLGWTAARLAEGGLDPHWRPDVLHVHDWHPALALAYVADSWPPVKSVFTIHNIDYQGRFPPADFNRLDLPHWLCAPYGPLEFFGDLCFLKAGVLLAHKVTTVSPTYAREVTEGQHGHGIDSVIRSRGDALIGILNGVNYSVWDPRNDEHLPARFGIDDLAGKARCKTTLRSRVGLNDRGDAPIFVVVSRLGWQKGSDLIANAADDLVARGAQLVVIGSGDRQIEERFKELQNRHGGMVTIHTEFSEPLAHLAIAGGDALIMPSRQEPCGLTQMYAKRYGTLPLVHAVGGLADTVTIETGFSFVERESSLTATIDRVLQTHQDRPRWMQMVSTAMRTDHSWGKSAEAYRNIYLQILGNTPS